MECLNLIWRCFGFPSWEVDDCKRVLSYVCTDQYTERERETPKLLNHSEVGYAEPSTSDYLKLSILPHLRVGDTRCDTVLFKHKNLRYFCKAWKDRWKHPSSHADFFHQECLSFHDGEYFQPSGKTEPHKVGLQYNIWFTNLDASQAC